MDAKCVHDFRDFFEVWSDWDRYIGPLLLGRGPSIGRYELLTLIRNPPNPRAWRAIQNQHDITRQTCGCCLAVVMKPIFTLWYNFTVEYLSEAVRILPQKSSVGHTIAG